MGIKRIIKIAPSSPQSGVSACNSEVTPDLIQNNDTTIKPYLNNYGGNLSKRWYIDFEQKGQRQREWIPSKPLENRAERAKARFQEICKGLSMGAGLTNLEILERLLNKKELRPKSKSTYWTDCKIFAAYFQHTPIAKISETKALEFYKHLKTKYTDKTVKNKINNLKAVFDSHKHNPLGKLRGTYNIQESEFNFPFSEYERELIESHLSSFQPDLYNFTRFIFYAYIRPAELIKIKISMVDMVTRTIKIPAHISKTKKAGAIPIIKPLLELIQSKRLLMYPQNFYLFGSGLKPSAKQANKNEATTLHKLAMQELGIYRHRETVLYSWKHTGNIMAYLAGTDIKIIQQVNRHSSIQTTEIYLRKLGLFLEKSAFDISY
jgi:integrase